MILNKLRSLEAGYLWQQIYKQAQKFPNLYAALVLFVALIGFAYLLLFPTLMLMGMWTLGAYVITGYTFGDIFHLAIWACITGISAINTIYLVKIKFRDTEGIPLEPQFAGNLHSLLNSFSHEARIPRIDNIVVSEQLSIDLVKTPVAPVPLWSKNTLVIGLPLMQCLSPDYFKCAVIRKLLQYTKHRHWLIKWLHQLRNVWMLYLNMLSANVTTSNFALAIFFHFYAPLYRDLATPIAHRNELEADLDSLQYINDEDLLQTIETIIVAKIYLDQQYWPKLEKLLKENQDNSVEPYSNLENVLKSGLTTKNTKRWLDSIYRDESHKMKAIPSLRARMYNIGRSRIRIPERIEATAANAYLDKDYAYFINGANHLWMRRKNCAHLNTTARDRNVSAENSTKPPSSFSTNVFQ
ncbi:hypothetical protein [Kaarinaea lacus]